MTANSALPADTADATKPETDLGLPTAVYFPRRLHFVDHKGDSHHVDEGEILATAGAKIVLGEPGMGKSELMREVGSRLGVEPVTAVRLMRHKSPAKLIVSGKPLLIDGLDEAMARRDGDAVDLILAQLEEAGSPEFILSCRSREWQERSISNLRQLYGVEPTVFTIEPLTRAEAKAFLEQRYAGADGDHVLDHLDENGLSDLYCNPLTLGLMGKVAEHDATLPATRAALFKRVCELIWSEHDPDRQDSELGQITEEQALSAAGAIGAGLMFSGAEAASLAGAVQLQEGDVRLADLEVLPGAETARAVFSSKLFHSVGVGRAKPIHKVIAEYLAARWLAQQAVTPRAQRRLLTQLHGSGGVPSSLRGMHAWLAFHSAAMAKRVISADPFGVLRYGEAANLTPAQAACMFDALCALAEINPFFRAGDWYSHAAAGLMTPPLREKINATIGSSASNEHLRSLLIQGLKDTPLAGALAETLEAVMLSGERFYSEREDAAEVLLPHRSRAWWQQTIEDLRRQGTEDSTRLALNLIEEIDCDVPDEHLVAAMFAEMGLTISPLPRVRKRRAHTIRSHSRIINALPVARLTRVLDLATDYAVLLAPDDWEHRNDVAEIVSGLIVRSIDEQTVGPSDARRLWRWLGALGHPDTIYRSEIKNVQARLKERDDLRRAIQHHVLYVARAEPTLWSAAFDLDHRMVGLNSEDVIWFLGRLADADNKDPSLRQDWCDLMQLGIGPDGLSSDVRGAGQRFQREDKQLEAFVYQLEHPKKSAWMLKHEREAAKRERERRADTESRRRHYDANRAALRAGELGAVLRPAQAYLGILHDVSREAPPADRIAEWFGADLGRDAMVGFEAVLHRADLPTPEKVAQGFAEDTLWTYCFAIMAGLLARQRAGDGFADLTTEVCTTGLLLCHHEHGMCADDDVPALRNALEAEVIPTAKDRVEFARLWIEPSLVAGRSHVSGLYMLAHDEQWQATGAALGERWLADFPNVPETIELQLVDCLTHSGALDALASIAMARASTVFRNVDHRLTWLAIDVLVRFDAVVSDLAGIGAQNPEFIWFLRNRLQLERRRSTLPLSVPQAKWIVSEFRAQWPYATLEGSSDGDRNPYDAADFLRAMINRLANDTSAEASNAMVALISEPPDSYSNLIRHMAAEQRQKRAEEEFAPLLPKGLGDLLTEGPPSNMDDLKSLVLEELAVAQKKLMGDDLDQVRDFWSDGGVPYHENRCRDRLAAMIEPELLRYDVQRVTEADMPQTKRADLAFSRGRLQLPMEVKGQWHPKVWEAATGQLDVQYLIDWRSEQRGIYCVMWFGDLPSKSGRRLKAPPKGVKRPKTADDMRKMLVERIPETRRAMIVVVVVDLTAGKP